MLMLVVGGGMVFEKSSLINQYILSVMKQLFTLFSRVSEAKIDDSLLLTLFF